MKEDRRSRLRADFHAQTARIAFADLQRYFAGGHIVLVAPELDLVDVAVSLAEDDTQRFAAWISEGRIASVGDEQARGWLDSGLELWAVVAHPWVLVQERREA